MNFVTRDMGIVEDITGEPDPDKPEPVEVVTLSEDITQGVIIEKELPFATLEDALKYAKALPQEERGLSFIRTSELVATLDKAEVELSKKPCDNSGICSASSAPLFGTKYLK
jgi:hypothetical protein